MWTEYLGFSNPEFADYFFIGAVIGFVAGWFWAKMSEWCKKVDKKQ